MAELGRVKGAWIIAREPGAACLVTPATAGIQDLPYGEYRSRDFAHGVRPAHRSASPRRPVPLSRLRPGSMFVVAVLGETLRTMIVRPGHPWPGVRAIARQWRASNCPHPTNFHNTYPASSTAAIQVIGTCVASPALIVLL